MNNDLSHDITHDNIFEFSTTTNQTSSVLDSRITNKRNEARKLLKPLRIH